MEAGDPFLQELEDAGLNEVKARLAAKIYSPIGPKSDIAKDWVLRKEQPLEVETRRLEDAHKVEQALTISRTAEAAERQALAAEKATRVAVAALVVAVGRNSKRHRYGSTLRGRKNGWLGQDQHQAIGCACDNIDACSNGSA